MVKSKELLPLTGYVHGGCSPIGMRKAFNTTVDETAQLFDAITFSGGRLGCQLELPPDELARVRAVRLRRPDGRPCGKELIPDGDAPVASASRCPARTL